MGISLGLVGLGSFGSMFVDLFKGHPLVDRIGLCDADARKLASCSEDLFLGDKLHSRDMFGSFEDMCRADFDALVIITQPWLHAPQAVAVMESGKDVYSAVPVIAVPDGDEILGWCAKIIKTCESTGQLYMLGETTVFRPQTMFCRRKAQEGGFGDFIYADGEYFHDLDAPFSLRKCFAWRASGRIGADWHRKQQEYVSKGIMDGPMHYPTHSVSGPVSVMNAHALKVNCHGYRNRNMDPFFEGSAFSGEFALFQMSNGATVRIAESRESPGYLGKDPDGEAFRIAGSLGTFSEGRWFEVKRPDFRAEIDFENLPVVTTTELKTEDMITPLPDEVEDALKAAMNKDKSREELRHIAFNPQCHGGSHPYLVHEFVDAVANRRQPLTNAWEAARYMAMGVMAHKSALREGETLNVPDWGSAPNEIGRKDIAWKGGRE